jgi:hypothetical protein
MSRALTKEDGALLKEAGEVFNETGCVPGIDGEQLPAERMVPDAKEYILETIDDPEAIYDPEIWDTPGFTGWHKNGFKDAISSHLAAVRTLSSI